MGCSASNINNDTKNNPKKSNNAQLLRSSTVESKINSLGSVLFSQNINSTLEIVQVEQPKEKIELFLALIETNSNANVSYNLSLGLHTKNLKGINSIGSTLSKFGGEAKIDFDKTFIIDYYFEVKQTLTITILLDEKKEHIIETSIGKIMGSRGQIFTQEFNIKGFTGKLQINGIPVKIDDCELSLNVNAMYKANRPYYLIKRNSGLNNKINWLKAYKSEVLTNYPANSKFKHISLSTQFLVNADTKKSILIEFYDFEPNSNNHKFIGGYTSSLEEIAANQNIISLTDNNGNPNENKVQFNSRINKKYTFLDYIRGGTQISMIIGIDFTASNVNPHRKESLHSIAKKPNLYEKAIDSCCSTVAYYDADQLFPVYGYGALLQDKVNHCFPINMTADPNIFTVKGVLDAYRNIINTIKLYGPTYFGPLIRECNEQAREAAKTNEVYSILMILTDGIINDMQDTIDAIVESSYLPLSIIIIGIGPGGDDGFEEMNFLDGDDEPIVNSKNQKCVRDIVQFVDFNKFNNDPIALAEQVLEEVPRQVEDYFKMIEKPPGDPIIF